MSYTLDENQFDPLPDLWELVSSENASGFEISLLAAAPPPVMEEPDGLAIIGGLGDEVSDGSSGGDNLLGGEVNAVHFVDDAGNLNAFGMEVYVVTKGGDGNDTLEGTESNDSIMGLSGDDYLSSGGGDDTLVGGEGSDTFDGGGKTTIVLDYQDGVDKIVDHSGSIQSMPGAHNIILVTGPRKPPGWEDSPMMVYVVIPRMPRMTQDGPDTIIHIEKFFGDAESPKKDGYEIRLIGVEMSVIDFDDFVHRPMPHP